jgi:phage terminase large subunit
MEFKYTRAVDKILAMKARKKVIQGGSSAGKTVAILSILIDEAARKPNTEISVISESIPHLKRGALKEFLKIMKSTGRWNESRYNASDRVYKFLNGSYIEFFSPESVLGSRRNILYVNESNNVLYSDYHQLAIRTSGDIYLDFNPAEEFWAHKEVLKEPDSELLILNYEDNEALPENVVSDFEVAKRKAQEEEQSGVKGYWSNWVKVYVYGQIGSLQGVVFQFKLIDKIPEEAQKVAVGLDWGFSNDPTAIVEVWRKKTDLYLHERMYQTGLTNSELIEAIKLMGIRGEIICDSAEPKSILDLQRSGLQAFPARKGPDSVRASIDRMQSFTIHVTKESLNLIREFRMYRWQTTRTGESTGYPVDAFNHGIDAVRYVVLNKLQIGTGSGEFFKHWI